LKILGVIILAKKYLSWSPIRRLMKHNGATLVARDAVDELIYWLEKGAEKIINTAATMAKHANRKKITVDDIRFAIKWDGPE